MMKKILALTLALLLLTGCSAAKVTQEILQENQVEEVTEEVVEEPGEAKETPAQPEAVPFGSFTADALDGGAATDGIFSAADLTVVNLWATYCGPCKDEMPVLAKLDNEMENVQFLGIVLDCTDQNGEPDPQQVELALDLTEAAGVTYTNLILNMDLAKLGVASVEAVPATLFVDADGNLVGQGFYGAKDEAGWRQVIAERLEMIAQ